MYFYLNSSFVLPFQPKNPKVLIMGIPFDSTSCEIPGSRFGPKKFRETLLRLYGLHKDTGVNVFKHIKDVGDVEVVHGDWKITCDNVNKAIEEVAFNGIFGFIGGEHLITYFALKALPYENLDLLIFDSHADCFETYKGEQISHISFVRKLIEEKLVRRVGIVGLNAVAEEEKDFIRRNVVELDSFEKLKDFVENSRKLYVSFDLDVLKFPLNIGTGSVEDSFLSLEDAKEMLGVVAKKTVAFDFVELNPLVPNANITAYACAFLFKHLIANIIRGREDDKV